ncbi:MAG: hypothetical protein J6A75_10265 [Lachnospiraceae bacterium]|nr:hypothetical protein [Lachnospiraceae bacterium]
MGILAGVFGIVIGIKIFADSHTYIDYDFFQLSAVEFGADFYTEIHQTVTRISNFIVAICGMLVLAVSSLFVFLGIADICFFAQQLQFSKDIKTVNCEIENQD